MENFVSNHKNLSDKDLIAIHPNGAFTPLSMFVCTYVAKLDNLHYNVEQLTKFLMENMEGCIVAINSNYGHAAQPGYSDLIKTPKKIVVEDKLIMKSRPRKMQGDGTCFNSAIEPIIKINHHNVNCEKLYKVKCFPTTGETQIPGVICNDLSDGRAALDAFVAILNKLNVGDIVDGEQKIITVVSQQPKMLNFKFSINRTSPRILVNYENFGNFITLLENYKICSESPEIPITAGNKFDNYMTIIPPFLIREVTLPVLDRKISFKFKCGNRTPRINIFQGGKVNILGADSFDAAQKIYQFFQNTFYNNWNLFICLQPRKDSEK